MMYGFLDGPVTDPNARGPKPVRDHCLLTRLRSASEWPAVRGAGNRVTCLFTRPAAARRVVPAAPMAVAPAAGTVPSLDDPAAAAAAAAAAAVAAAAAAAAGAAAGGPKLAVGARVDAVMNRKPVLWACSSSPRA